MARIRLETNARDISDDGLLVVYADSALITKVSSIDVTVVEVFHVKNRVMKLVVLPVNSPGGKA